MAIRPFINPSDANAIAMAEYKDDSTWHFQLSISWIAYAERKSSIAALIYSAIHLRLGIERLWFEIYEVALNLKMSEDEFREAVKKSTKLYKLIQERHPSYFKFIEFTDAVREIDPSIGPPIANWDLHRLSRIHGECSERLLHFKGTAATGIGDETWRATQFKYLHESVAWIISYATKQGNLVIFRPDLLQKPEVFDIWTAFSQGETDVEGIKIRMRLVEHRLPKIRRRR